MIERANVLCRYQNQYNASRLMNSRDTLDGFQGSFLVMDILDSRYQNNQLCMDH